MSTSSEVGSPYCEVYSHALLQLCSEIDHVLVEEMEALASCQIGQTERFVARKSHLTLEMQKLLLASKGIALSQAVQSAMLALSAKLVESESAIRRRISAISEIAKLIGDIYASEHSDGMYSRTVTVRRA